MVLGKCAIGWQKGARLLWGHTDGTLSLYRVDEDSLELKDTSSWHPSDETG